MPAFDVGKEEIVDTLASEHVVRVAFHDEDSVYLIPLGYVWVEGALYGVMESGQKTQLAAKNPQVAFQVDTSWQTGLFEWASVTGEGRFEVVSDEGKRQRAMTALKDIVEQAPPWWQQEQGPRLASGTLQVWRITPTRSSGRRYAPPTDRR